jgi:2-methylisocitrate lyase-like PEP mutase family enzyme
MTIASRRAAFRALHERGCFVIPNPWDRGSARYLVSLGFKALATTSSGYAWSRGLTDGDAVPVDETLAHFADIAAGVEVPVNADFQHGYAVEPEGVAANVTRCVATGVAGLSIEDSTGDPARPLFELPLAVERVAAARRAIDAAGGEVLLTARAECYLVGHPKPLAESLRRLEAYAAAGADVLYAPGPRTRDDIRAIVAAVAPRPVNLLVAGSFGIGVADAADLGVRRISVGGALARTAWTAFMRAARAIAEDGSFAGFEGAASHGEIDAKFR